MDNETNSPAPQALPVLADPAVETVPVAAHTADLDNDGHDDATGQFVEGNQEASSAPEVSGVEARLTAAVEAMLAAAVEFAEDPSTPQLFVGNGYQMQFAGCQLSMLTTA
jgi:hypothetical protein